VTVAEDHGNSTWGLMFAETRRLTFDEGRVRDKEMQDEFVIAANSRLEACLYTRHVGGKQEMVDGGAGQRKRGRG
jgi:hypothetical protein